MHKAGRECSLTSANKTGPHDSPFSVVPDALSEALLMSAPSAPDSAVVIFPEQKIRYTRNRTGCLTCRIRKIRCDETKPDCVRCTSTGRKCDGYSQPPSRASKKSSRGTKSSRPTSPLGILWCVEDLRRLTYFQTRTTIALSGRFHSAFWNTLVQQYADNEPAVLQALITAAQFHEILEIGGMHSVGGNKELQLAAIRNYSKALSMVREPQFASNPDATLVACVLFVCIELMQNNYNGAVVHVKHGLRILEQLQARQSLSHNPPSHKRKLVIQMFRSILNQAFFTGRLFGKYGQANLLTPLIDTPPAEFTTLDQAHEALQSMGLLVLQSQCMGSGTGAHHVHRALHRQWQASMALLTAGLRRAEANSAAAILQLQATALHIMSDALSTGDAAFEAATPMFRAIVAGAAQLLESKDQTQRPSHKVNLSFEAGLIGPLYYTAIKCRALPVRLRALRLLDVAPRQEGIWSAGMAARIAKRFIKVEMEEQKVKLVGDMSLGSWVRQRGLTLAVAAPRMYEQGIRIRIGREGDIGINEEVISW
ncbi:hypothetical protein V1509DRAFT_633381 [Lipomyces kononenkoae]